MTTLFLIVMRALSSTISSSRRIVKLISESTRIKPMKLRISEALSTSRPLSDKTISPTINPAFSAGEFSSICAMTTPRFLLAPKALARSGVRVCTKTPRRPRLTLPYSNSCRVISITMLIGIAKPMPMFPLLPKIAVLMPITSPSRLMSAPPELPGLMEASVWMKSSYDSMPRPFLPKALTMPRVTLCSRPNGLPIARTKSPTLSFSESPVFAC